MLYSHFFTLVSQHPTTLTLTEKPPKTDNNNNNNKNKYKNKINTENKKNNNNNTNNNHNKTTPTNMSLPDFTAELRSAYGSKFFSEMSAYDRVVKTSLLFPSIPHKTLAEKVI